MSIVLRAHEGGIECNFKSLKMKIVHCLTIWKLFCVQKTCVNGKISSDNEYFTDKECLHIINYKWTDSC